MKALILTRQLEEYPELQEQMEEADMLKIAVNHSPCKADYRVFHDYNKWYEYNKEKYTKRGEKLVTVYGGLLVMPEYIWMYYKPLGYPSFCNDKNEVIKDHKKGGVQELYFDSGSIIPAIDLATRLGAGEILIFADNTVYNTEFKERIIKAILKLKDFSDLYCFKEDNNFNLPYKSFSAFK